MYIISGFNRSPLFTTNWNDDILHDFKKVERLISSLALLPCRATTQICFLLLCGLEGLCLVSHQSHVVVVVVVVVACLVILYLIKK